MDSQPQHTDDAPTGLQAAVGRRTFIRRAAIGAGAVGAIALVPTLVQGDPTTTDGATVATTAAELPQSTDPMVVYVRDAARGEAVIMAGATETVITDRALVAHLLRAQDRHLA